MVHSRLRRAAVVAAAAAMGVGVLPAAPALAGTSDTEGTTSVAVTGSTLQVRAEPIVGSEALGAVPSGTVDVACQVQGDVVNDGERSTAWWAKVPELGGYVSALDLTASADRLSGVSNCASTNDRARAASPSADGDVTIEELRTIFGDLGDEAVINEGLPSLNEEMQAAEITNPERKSAFLATIYNESGFRYDADEAGQDVKYRGRGFIQLTSDANYGPAGDYLGIDLLGDPDLAKSLEWSAKIANWYWTVARPDTNEAADSLDMGLVSRYIGYADSAAEDEERCDHFKKALEFYTEQPPPDGIVCRRH